MTDQPGNDVDQTAADGVFADQLDAARPVPAAGFRGALGRHLETLDPRWGPRPENLWLISACCVVAGLVLLLIAAAQAGVL